MDERRARPAKLASQVAHVRLDDLGLPGVAPAPHAVQQLGLGQHRALVPQQARQQPKLSGGQVHRGLAPVDRPAFLVQDQVAAAQRRAQGNAPEYPRETRVLRIRLSRPAHQCVGDALGVAARFSPLPVVPPTMLVDSGLNRTSCACSVWCERVPTMTARSPRARPFVVCHAFIVKLVIIGVGMALTGVVAVCVTAAVVRVTVTVTVRSVPATWTVTVWVAVLGVSMAAAVVGLPASSVVAGSMLPDCMACCVAAVFAVSAAVLAETFWNVVAPEVSHRCRSPLADCKMMNWFVAITTMPRWMSSVLPRCEVWL